MVDSSDEVVTVPFQTPGSVVPASCEPAVGNNIPSDEFDGSSSGAGLTSGVSGLVSCCPEEVLVTTGLFFGRSGRGRGSA